MSVGPSPTIARASSAAALSKPGISALEARYQTDLLAGATLAMRVATEIAAIPG
jgi:hypothetical protein